MSFYSQLAVTAAKLIKDKGQLMVLVTTPAGSYSAATGAVSGQTESRTDVYGVVIDFPAKEVDGTNVQRLDRKVLMEAGVADPSTFDKVEIGGVLHEIITAKQLAPGGTNVIYTLQVRKGG